MNRTELVLAMSATLFAAFVLGWLLRWAFGRLNQVNSVDVTEIDQLATRLHDAELSLSEAQNALVQKEAELEAAMDGLGIARRESAGFQDELARLHAAMTPPPAPDPIPDPQPVPMPSPDTSAQDLQHELDIPAASEMSDTPAAAEAPEPAPKPKAKRAPRKTASKRKTAAKKPTAKDNG
jgi:outer membrane biosynthesis protein TonB